MSYKVTNVLVQTVNKAMVCAAKTFAFYSGRVDGAALGDAGDEGPLYGGGHVPVTGAQAATGTGQQDVSHLAVSPSQGRKAQSACCPDWSGRWRAYPNSGA